MYPTWRYHATSQPRIVHSEAEETALGPGWFDHPEKAKAYAAEQAVASGDPAALPAALPATLDDLSVADAVKLLPAVSDSAVLQAWLDAELKKAKPRATVTRELSARLEALKPAQ